MMKTCEVSIILANAMAIYCLACVFYMALTRCMSSPFMDSQSPEQNAILQKSRRQRKNVFILGCALSLWTILYFKPFKECQPKI